MLRARAAIPAPAMGGVTRRSTDGAENRAGGLDHFCDSDFSFGAIMAAAHQSKGRYVLSLSLFVACMHEPAAAFLHTSLKSSPRQMQRQGLCGLRAAGDDGGGGFGGFFKQISSSGVGGWVQKQLNENMGKVEQMQQDVRGDGVMVAPSSAS
jgi:hypothetical protein